MKGALRLSQEQLTSVRNMIRDGLQPGDAGYKAGYAESEQVNLLSLLVVTNQVAVYGNG